MSGKVERRIHILLTLCIVFWILLLGVYQYTWGYQMGMHSDTAGDLLHGQYVAQQGRIFFADHWHPSTELRTVANPDAVFALLFHFTSSWQIVWALGSVICYVLLAICAYFCARSCSLSRIDADLVVILYLLPNTLLGGAIIIWLFYTLYVAEALLFAGMYVRMRKEAGKLQKKWLAALAGVSLVIGLNGIRMLLILAVPLVCTEWIVWWKQKKDEAFERRILFDLVSHMKWALLCASCMVVGFAVLRFVLEPRYAYGRAQLIPIIWKPGQVLTQALDLLPHRILSLFGAGGQASVFTPTGILYGLQYAIAFLAMGIAWSCIRKVFREKAETSCAFIMLFSAVAGIIMLICLCLTDMGGEGGLTKRYMAVGFWGLPMILIGSYGAARRRGIRLVVSLILVAATVICSGLPLIRDIRNAESFAEAPTSYARWLEDRGYRFGAATFWHAGLTTARTDGRLEMKNIRNDHEFSFYAWLQPEEYREREVEFVMLTHEECEERFQNGMEQPAGVPVYEDSVYKIFDMTGKIAEHGALPEP